MKLFKILLTLCILNNCSFDNKTGIWENENKTVQEKDLDIFKDFKKISSKDDLFQETISLKNTSLIKISKSLNNKEWKDFFYNYNNNFDNFSYKNNNQIIFKSKKIANHKINKYLLFDNNHLITSNEKGDIIIFSVVENKVISKFNFYKKKYKNINKKLSYIIEDKIVYVSDNLGYFYAFNYEMNKILWAKDYKVPFRSNLKIVNNKLIASNQNNNLYFLKKNSGEILNQIPTEETSVKNEFISNLSIFNSDKLFFLNTYGSLYSIDIESSRIDWFLNLNSTTDLTISQLFYGTQIINDSKNIIVSSNKKTFIIDAYSGEIKKRFNFAISIKPIIHKNNVFLLTKNNFLVAINLDSNNILYSYNISDYLNQFKSSNNENIIFEFMFINNEIFLFLKNSYLLKFDIYGKFKDTIKIPSSITTKPISINSSILFLSKKNKLVILN